MLILTSLKYSIDFTVALSKGRLFYSDKKCHSLPGIPEKVHITAKFQKSEFDKHATSGVAQKMKFSIKDFFSKCDQIRIFLRIWSHLLKKSLMENFGFCAVASVNLMQFIIDQNCHNSY